MAKLHLEEAYKYYKEVASKKVAKSIKVKIFGKTRKLARFPEMGQLENNPLVAAMNYRYLVSGNHKIVYRVIPEQKEVLIVALFDTRQNPDDFPH